MTTPIDLNAWNAFESDRWRDAVRNGGLLLRSLDPEERLLVLEAINLDLERRRRAEPADEPAE